MNDNIIPRRMWELDSHYFDSTIWMPQIIAQLLFRSAEDLKVAEMSP